MVFEKQCKSAGPLLRTLSFLAAWAQLRHKTLFRSVVCAWVAVDVYTRSLSVRSSGDVALICHQIFSSSMHCVEQVPVFFAFFALFLK